MDRSGFPRQDQRFADICEARCFFLKWKQAAVRRQPNSRSNSKAKDTSWCKCHRSAHQSARPGKWSHFLDQSSYACSSQVPEWLPEGSEGSAAKKCHVWKIWQISMSTKSEKPRIQVDQMLWIDRISWLFKVSQDMVIQAWMPWSWRSWTAPCPPLLLGQCCFVAIGDFLIQSLISQGSGWVAKVQIWFETSKKNKTQSLTVTVWAFVFNSKSNYWQTWQ